MKPVIPDEFLMQGMPRAMVVRKGIYVAAIAGTILWLLLLLSGFSWSGWSEALSSLGRQQSRENNGDLVSRTVTFFFVNASALWR